MKKSITALWIAVGLLTRVEKSQEKDEFSCLEARADKKRSSLLLTLLSLFLLSSLSPLDSLLSG